MHLLGKGRNGPGKPLPGDVAKCLHLSVLAHFLQGEGKVVKIVQKALFVTDDPGRNEDGYQTFGAEIDRYTMDQAVADGITVPIKYHPRIAKVLLDEEKVKLIEAYYKQCADEGATKEDILASKKAMSSMEIILGEPERLHNLAADIYKHFTAALDTEPERRQKAMIVCSTRQIAYDLLMQFKQQFPEWFEEKKSPWEDSLSKEKLSELKLMPTIAMVATNGKNDPKEMYNYLGGVANNERNEMLDACFKQENSKFRIWSVSNCPSRILQLQNGKNNSIDTQN